MSRFANKTNMGGSAGDVGEAALEVLENEL